MKTFFHALKASFISMTLFTIILGVLYPALIFAIGQLCFQKKANGSLVYSRGKIVGSELIAQNFAQPQYFHPRASSAGSKGYDAANSSGSNLGPTSKKLVDALAQRASDFRLMNNISAQTPIPADAITSSGSGLDPHISVQNAYLQAPRIAKQRGISLESVRQLIAKKQESSFFNFFGQPYVNVLLLNLALDQRGIKKERS